MKISDLQHFFWNRFISSQWFLFANHHHPIKQIKLPRIKTIFPLLSATLFVWWWYGFDVHVLNQLHVVYFYLSDQTSKNKFKPEKKINFKSILILILWSEKFISFYYSRSVHKPHSIFLREGGCQGKVFMVLHGGRVLTIRNVVFFQAVNMTNFILKVKFENVFETLNLKTIH